MSWRWWVRGDESKEDKEVYKSFVEREKCVICYHQNEQVIN